MGQTMYSEKINNRESVNIVLSTENWNSGLYYIICNNESKVYFKGAFVKQ